VSLPPLLKLINSLSTTVKTSYPVTSQLSYWPSTHLQPTSTLSWAHLQLRFEPVPSAQPHPIQKLAYKTRRSPTGAGGGWAAGRLAILKYGIFNLSRIKHKTLSLTELKLGLNTSVVYEILWEGKAQAYLWKLIWSSPFWTYQQTLFPPETNLLLANIRKYKLRRHKLSHFIYTITKLWNLPSHHAFK